MPEEDTQLTPATRLLAKRREMAEVEGELINSKEVRRLRITGAAAAAADPIPTVICTVSRRVTRTTRPPCILRWAFLGPISTFIPRH